MFTIRYGTGILNWLNLLYNVEYRRKGDRNSTVETMKMHKRLQYKSIHGLWYFFSLVSWNSASSWIFIIIHCNEISFGILLHRILNSSLANKQIYLVFKTIYNAWKLENEDDGRLSLVNLVYILFFKFCFISYFSQSARPSPRTCFLVAPLQIILILRLNRLSNIKYDEKCTVRNQIICKYVRN